MSILNQVDTNKLNIEVPTDSLAKAFPTPAGGSRLTNVNKLKHYLMLVFSIIAVAMTIISTGLTYTKSNRMLTKKVSSLTSELTSQMKLNIENYLHTLEKTSTLIYANEQLYTYYAGDPTIDEYDALNIESDIAETLNNLCIMQNYVDFGLIYSNNHPVGKISNGTKDLFGDTIYEDLSSVIDQASTRDGWATGCKVNYNRIYYVKRINPNSIFVASFYPSELSDVFKYPSDMKNMTVRLVNENDIIIYSSMEEEIGAILPEDIQDKLEKEASTTFINNDFLVTESKCAEKWKVICTIPTSDILKEKKQLLAFSIFVILVCSLLSVALISIFSKKATNPVDIMMKKLNKKAHIDQLTGILNKISFQEFVNGCLACSPSGTKYALILIDVDDFKNVNDTLGHAEGDKVLSNVGKLLHSCFREKDILGRIGGDEFCVLMCLPELSDEQCLELINSKCSKICDTFRSTYAGPMKDYKISASLGIALYDMHGSTFEELYESADKALYMSKREGKDTYTIFNKA